MESNYIFWIIQGGTILIGFGAIFGMLKMTLKNHGDKLERTEKSAATMNSELGDVRDRLLKIEIKMGIE